MTLTTPHPTADFATNTNHRRATARRRRTTRRALLGIVGAAAALAVVGPSTACAQHPYQEDARVAPISSQFSVSVEAPGGGQLPAYWEGESMWVEGRTGQAYNIRVQNHSPRRVEAVVTVDGRDVLSGQEGDYAKHRGYVIQPYGSVVIDGFRQSLDHVATFRFTNHSDAYSSRMGTPQNVGVIGVALFEEKATRHRPQPRPVQPRRYYEDDRRAPSADPKPWGARGDRARGNSPAPPREESWPGADGAGAPESTPSKQDSRAYDGDGYGRGYGTRPRRDERLGTQYGETRYSSVREVTFKRHRSRRPDALLTVYYDSREGLEARGVIPEPPIYPPYSPYPPYTPEPEPWPSAQFAPPPPARRY